MRTVNQFHQFFVRRLVHTRIMVRENGIVVIRCHPAVREAYFEELERLRPCGILYVWEPLGLWDHLRLWWTGVLSLIEVK